MKKHRILCVVVLAVWSAAADAKVVCNCKTDSVGDVEIDCKDLGGWKFSLAAKALPDGTEEVRLAVESADESVPPPFTVGFSVSKCGLHHVWNPFDERFPCCWTSQESSFSSGLPLRVNFDDNETNVLTVAVSDALNDIRFGTNVGMRNGNDHRMSFSAAFFGDACSPRKSYAVIFRLDPRQVFWSQAAEDGVRWISQVSGRLPAVPPPTAFEPLYSSWYVFRGTVTQAALEPELERAAELGMKGVILDDGWQADRGDWNVDTNKFPGLRGHVAKAHALGLKYMIWFALPHLRTDSPAYPRFRNMCLSEKPDGWGDYILDPRFPQVRAHIVRRLTELIRDYGLDGFKLDFIDQFVSQRDDLAVKRNFAGYDYRSVPEAVERLLADISEAVNAVKPGALIEFRQRYVGPVVRQYGNMLRANDCPGDFEANRYRTLALRVTSPGSAVHSDMLLWRNDDSVSEVMRQIWNVAFSVVQYSAYLKGLPPEHLEAVRKAISFTTEHRKTLLHGKLKPHHPEFGYPYVEAESDDERIVIAYLPEYVVRFPHDGKRTIVVNATTADSLWIETADGVVRLPVGRSDYRCVDSTGGIGK